MEAGFNWNCCLPIRVKIFNAIAYRLGVRPRARMQVSKAADLPPAPARAAWRSQSVVSVRKVFGVGLVLPVGLALLTVGGGGGGGGCWVAQAGNKNSSAAIKLSFMSRSIDAKLTIISR
jgi:hypothetical protein